MLNIRKRKAPKNMGLGMIAASFIFYFLPDFTVLDLLPDVIGYMLMFFGLTALADLSEGMSDVKRKFGRLIIFGVIKFFSLFLIYGLLDDYERPNATLSVLFVFALIEVCFLIPACKSLFDALIYIGTKEESTAVFNRKNKRFRKSYTDSIKLFTIIFIFIKNWMAIFPEFLSLAANVDVQSHTYTRYDDINYFRILAMTVSLVMGIIWLCKIEKYFSGLKHDLPFVERLKERYEAEVLPNEALFRRRKITVAFCLYIIGAFLAIDFYIGGNDGNNIIPDIISALFFLSGSLFMIRRKSSTRLFSLGSCSIYGILSFVTWILNYEFTYHYTAKEVSRDVIANTFWIILLIVSVIEALCFCAMILSIVKELMDTVKEDTGHLSVHQTIDPIQKAKLLHKELNKHLYISFTLGGIASAGIPLRVWMFSSESYLSDISWIIEMVLTTIFAVYFTRSLFIIKGEVEEKYRLM